MHESKCMGGGKVRKERVRNTEVIMES